MEKQTDVSISTVMPIAWLKTGVHKLQISKIVTLILKRKYIKIKKKTLCLTFTTL